MEFRVGFADGADGRAVGLEVDEFGAGRVEGDDVVDLKAHVLANGGACGLRRDGRDDGFPRFDDLRRGRVHYFGRNGEGFGVRRRSLSRLAGVLLGLGLDAPGFVAGETLGSFRLLLLRQLVGAEHAGHAADLGVEFGGYLLREGVDLLAEHEDRRFDRDSVRLDST